VFFTHPRFYRQGGRQWTFVALFYDLDKFAVTFERFVEAASAADGKSRRNRPSRMCLSEIMTILVLFHASN